MKKLIFCTTLALLLASGSAFAAEDAAQPNAPQPDAAAPNAAQSDRALPGAAQSDVPGQSTVPRDQAATPPAEQTPTARSDEMIGTVPGGSLPISAYYNQTVYDGGDNKIGDVNDLLLDDSGKINAAIIGVGGVLGVGEKNVAVPFSLLKVADKDGSQYLVLEANKEALLSAPGYVYDSGKKIWLPATKQG